GEVIRAVCLDVNLLDGSYVAECYSILKRRLYRIHIPNGRICKSWELQFVVRNTDKNGISYVDSFNVLEQTELESKYVVLGSDGVVRVRHFK
ncbi:unnamed protein product, partial [Strongylus vulgaris]